MKNIDKKSVITKEQAIKIADKFIVENGYTDIKATLPKEKIFIDPIEQNLGESIEEILELRFNSIEKVHCRVYSDDIFWYVVYRKINNPTIGRAVLVDKNTGEAKMMHEEVTAEQEQ
jgi:hypothetical protein